MTSSILNMDQADDIERAGGKAAALARLAQAGFDVPPFVVVEPDAFNARSMSVNAKRELLGKLEAIGSGPYAARSSAREEDGSDHSHAGQFLSVLNLSPEELSAACTRVWKSGIEGSVADYRASQGLDGRGDAPAVIVQQMVDARCAGVVFTADPVNGRRDRIVISAIAGLGDALVGGEEDGQTYILDRSESIVIEGPDDGVLNADDLAALHQLAIKVEETTGSAQDIEWAFEGPRLFLLQARPITTVLRPVPATDDHLSLFDNSNIVESYPGLVSPLTYSFAQYAYSRVYRSFVDLLGVDARLVQSNAAVFDNMLARIDGRVYYNLINWYRALAMLPGFSINRSHMETMMGVSEPLPENFLASVHAPTVTRFGRVREWLRIGRVAIGLGVEAIRLEGTIRDFYRRLNLALEQPADVLDEMPLAALAAEYRRIESDLLDKWDAPLINDFLCMMAFGASRKLLEKWGGSAGLEVHNDIMIGQGDIVSAEPAQRIATMGRLLKGHEEARGLLATGDDTQIGSVPGLEEELDAYLAKFSDRCAEELKLESVPLNRDPTQLYMAISAAALTPDLHKPSKNKSTKAGLQKLFSGRPLRRFFAGIIVGWAKTLVRNRENLRFERTRIFGRARHLFRAVGRQFYAHGKIAEIDDIFYLTVQEILGVIEGFSVDMNIAEIAAMRKAEMEVASGRPDPGERLIVHGAVLTGLEMQAPAPTPISDNAKIQSGTGCSAGKVTAVARVVHDPRTQGINHGEILVARHTDPGWIAVFANASAIVVERGSLLSHSAIVARELGIPCVVGLKGAMEWIKDGETVEVDGASGVVRRVG